jgi:L-cysteine/cystine lyase
LFSIGSDCVPLHPTEAEESFELLLPPNHVKSQFLLHPFKKNSYFRLDLVHQKMETKRRTFLKQLGSLTIGSTVLPYAMQSSAVAAENNFEHLLPPYNEGEHFWAFVRDQFPLKKSRVYFNNGTMGPSPYPVIEMIKKSLIEANTEGEYAVHEASREKLAEFLNAKTSEISLTHNTTEGLNIIALGLPLKKGDEVIMTSHEHVGNAAPWLNVAKLKGVIIKTFIPAATAKENIDRVNALINSKTKAIAIPHITCTTGVVMPVKEIAALGKSKKLFVCIDGAHGPGSVAVDMKELNCDFYASCGHKWLMGPLGTGFLYVKEEMLDVLQPYNIGAYSIDTYELSEQKQLLGSYAPSAHKYDYGTQSPYLYQGLAAAVNFVSLIGAKRVAERSRTLAQNMQEQLLSLDKKIEMLTPTETQSRGTMIGFRVKGMELSEFEKKANQNFFRLRMVRESNLNSVRVSTHIYNNFDEINEFVDFIKKV